MCGAAGVVATRSQRGKRRWHSLFGGMCRCGWNRTQEFPHQTIKFCVFDQVSSLLSAERSTQDARQTKHRLTSARQTEWRVVLTDQFTFHAENGRLQRQKGNVFEPDKTHLAWFLRESELRR